VLAAIFAIGLFLERDRVKRLISKSEEGGPTSWRKASPKDSAGFHCVKCGTELPLGSKWCDNCGTEQHPARDLR
jgi:hypothetical protein